MTSRKEGQRETRRALTRFIKAADALAERHAEVTGCPGCCDAEDGECPDCAVLAAYREARKCR